MVNRDIALRELLDCCSDPESLDWEQGWTEFIRRYKKFIYKKVAVRCSYYNDVSRIQRQFSGVVNEIVHKVLLKLYENKCQALKGFRARDNEPMFLAWLATISIRTANRHIASLLKMPLSYDQEGSSDNQIDQLESIKRWELYETVTEELRKQPRRNANHLERDIHIFQLYTLGGFSAEMIASHPCLKGLGHRVVDNVVNRLRTYLRQHKENFGAT